MTYITGGPSDKAYKIWFGLSQKVEEVLVYDGYLTAHQDANGTWRADQPITIK